MLDSFCYVICSFWTFCLFVCLSCEWYVYFGKNFTLVSIWPINRTSRTLIIWLYNVRIWKWYGKFHALNIFRVNLTWTILFSVSFSLSRSLTLSFLFLSRSIFWSAIWFKSVNLLHLHTDVSEIAVICLSFWLPFIFFPRFYLSLCSHSIDTWCLIFFVLLSFVSFPFFLFNGINCIQILYSLWLLCVRCSCCCFVPPSSPSKFLYTLEFFNNFYAKLPIAIRNCIPIFSSTNYFHTRIPVLFSVFCLLLPFSNYLNKSSEKKNCVYVLLAFLFIVLLLFLIMLFTAPILNVRTTSKYHTQTSSSYFSFISFFFLFCIFRCWFFFLFSCSSDISSRAECQCIGTLCL